MYKSGFVGLIGRPNVGKSTLLNTIIGEQISITSNVPQTTRNQIKGIFSDVRGQIVFIDTPGIHQTTAKFGEILNETALNVLSDSDIDVVLYIVDVSRPFGPEEKFLSENILHQKKPFILVFNKIDCPRTFIKEYTQLFSDFKSVDISALNKTNTEELIEKIFNYLPEGEPYFDPEEITDQNLRFITAEIIRKHVIINMQDEIPHATAVRIEEFKELPDGSAVIDAVIYVETESQKKIMIGKDGSKIKTIKNFSKRELKNFIQGSITLTLNVKEKHNWRKNNGFLKSLGYTEKTN
ncbi:MAG: GTPase Era [Candidatus Margulisiibacteriota bacterium]|nr:MAG: GTPase Era [Candidatus Margulisbacteria bacterium GWD2_39_127]OGI01753.1 MAG: GTPase Era [Candidatus Margulisbacteria bacterium GWF2_38_17]OGI10678.1 MAG: GTPase Era [Candidatus Margulisbacteria bacterium GWE2_39_32]PZM77240.1 MAG: GTPase Era [Candidatus Margulisiibacteriota bacterium]HAR63678.1 GTPase Era [Candidatus Margulisiibacteriota bacterium]